jgi:hypothetical protein
MIVYPFVWFCSLPLSILGFIILPVFMTLLIEDMTIFVDEKAT